MNRRTTIAGAALAAALGLLGAAGASAQDGFRFFGPLARVLTPNGDGINDRAFLCLDNPADSGVAGRVYTLLGAEVASMNWVRSALAGCPGGTVPQHVTWDGRGSQGSARSGVYVYLIEAEGRRYAGTLLVVR